MKNKDIRNKDEHKDIKVTLSIECMYFHIYMVCLQSNIVLFGTGTSDH